MYQRKLHHNRAIVRLDGDPSFDVDPRRLRMLLKRDYRRSQGCLASCLHTLSSDWTLSVSNGRQAMFYVSETDERLLAARFRVGNDRQLVVVGSASKHGVFGQRITVLEHTKEFIEPVSRNGKSWRRDIWRVWDPFSKHGTTCDRWPSVIRFLENTTSEIAGTDTCCCPMSAKEIYTPAQTTQNTEQSLRLSIQGFRKDFSDSDSDVPLCQKRQYLIVDAEPSDLEEDIPLLELRKDKHAMQHHGEQRAVSTSTEQNMDLAETRSMDVVSVASSSGDVKDYCYWKMQGLIDHIPGTSGN